MNITCEDGWIQYNRSCYKYVRTATYWTSAFRACQAQNSYLADVDSDEELDFLMSKILNSIDYSDFFHCFVHQHISKIRLSFECYKNKNRREQKCFHCTDCLISVKYNPCTYSITIIGISMLYL